MIELLVVIAAIAVLSALLIPMISGMIERSHRANCSSNLRAIGGAAHLYAADHQGMLPGIRWSAPSDGQPADSHPGQQWDAQIMPYLNMDPASMASKVRTVFSCPAAPLFEDLPMSRQLSYAWNARLSESFDSKRQSNMEHPSTILMAVDNKVIGGGPDQNTATFGSSNNTIYTNNNLNKLKRIPYDRHGGEANILFVDGSVSQRGPVDPENDNTPIGVRFYSGGPLSTE